MGENSYITIHDNLDSSISHIKAVIDNHALFDNTKIVPLMDGLPRSLFFSPYDLRIVLFVLLPAYWAIVVNTFLVKFTAFIGMYYLLDKHILNGERTKYRVGFWISLIFALVPFYPDYGISSAGIPLLVYAFLNLRDRKSVWSGLLIIVYFGLYSVLVLSGLFVCIALFVYMLIWWFNNKRIPFYYFGGLVLLSVIYFCTNWSLFDSFFFPTGYVSHRIEFCSDDTFFSVQKGILDIIVFSQYHAGAFFAFPILLVFVIIFFLYRKENFQLTNLLGWLISIVGLCFAANIFRWLLPTNGIMQEFQFDRFYFLFPSLCFVIMAVTMEVCLIHKKKIIAYLLLIVVGISTFYYNPEYRYFVKYTLKGDVTNVPSYAQFYDESLFNQIEKSISDVDRSQYKVLCLGIYPSVLEFNCFNTLDSYVTNYPLSYKHQFRKVIVGELDKSEMLKQYFDDWGSRCYLFSSELGNDYLWGKERKGRVMNLEIDIRELEKLGCSYIFSAVDIDNYQFLNLDFAGSYTTSSSFWNIKVYKICS